MCATVFQVSKGTFLLCFSFWKTRKNIIFWTIIAVALLGTSASECKSLPHYPKKFLLTTIFYSIESRHTCFTCLRCMEDEQGRNSLACHNLYWKIRLCIDELPFNATSYHMCVLGFLSLVLGFFLITRIIFSFDGFTTWRLLGQYPRTDVMDIVCVALILRYGSVLLWFGFFCVSLADVLARPVSNGYFDDISNYKRM